ncbi:S-layer homology domain-containing protein [Falsibacillus pallidus]|uniref:S-layer family protein n=1 Tax=Falsibacillus pallidus TaxID=493781 RepID=A0A370GDU6_9BACI|nr:S-layer homology domain-containing protein [Falsibacillus pallidus]RDI40163.1 S-layer family protein [Falsibacillus pallidus]
MKRLFLFFMALFLVAGGFQGKSALAASDDITGITLEQEMRAMIAAGVMQGYGEGIYKPAKEVTRGEFATFLSRALTLPEGEPKFKDVALSSKLAVGINSASQAGIINGYNDGRFGPNDPVTREQMAQMIANALDYLVIEKVKDSVQFKDEADFTSSIFKSSVLTSVHYGIINGFNDGEFKPKQKATRDQAAAMISRLLDTASQQEQETEPPSDADTFKVATIVDGQLKYSSKNYSSMDQASAAITDSNNQVVTQGADQTQIVKMKSGVAVAKATVDSAITIIYAEDLKTQLTYVVPQTELRYIDADDQKVKVQIAETIGYVKQTAVTLVPNQLKQGQSYYMNNGGSLEHYIFSPAAGTYASYVYGKAPSFLTPGVKYYSWDGHTFLNENGTKVGDAYQYFNYLSVRTTTSYTADQLNQYVNAVKTDSPLKTQGAAFKKAEELYHINALYLLANAIHESNYGLSSIAKDKFNLFGIKAYDGDPYNSAQTFTSFEECILYQAEKLSSRYVNPSGGYDNGAIPGNKSVGMNVKYASDPYWGQKIAGHMYRADNYLKNADFGKYSLGVTSVSGLNVRQQPNTLLPAEFTYKKVGLPIVILESTPQPDGTWIKTIPDLYSYTDAYIHGDFVTEIPIAK